MPRARWVALLALVGLAAVESAACRNEIPAAASLVRFGDPAALALSMSFPLLAESTDGAAARAGLGVTCGAAGSLLVTITGSAGALTLVYSKDASTLWGCGGEACGSLVIGRGIPARARGVVEGLTAS